MDVAQLRKLRPKLQKYLKRFDDCFPRKDTRAHLPVYVSGQLSDIPEKSVEPIAASETRLWPGATRSGLGSASYHVGPRELYGATTSSAREIVLFVSSAPTVIADGAFAGLRMPP